jgi:orotidine-5'-phosphate decarboxylase
MVNPVKFRELIARSAERRRSRIVLALDVVGPLDRRIERARQILKDVAGDVAAVKLNMHLLLPFGLLGLQELVSDCRGYGTPVIADIKLNDIEATNRDAVTTLFMHGLDAVIANPFVGFKEGLSGVLQIGRERDKGVILLVYMSHAGAREGYGVKLLNGQPMYIALAEKTRKWNADGAIVSARSLPVLRAVRKKLRADQIILSPGVGAQGGDAKRALRAGSDYVIVGRSITEAHDPARAVRKLRRESDL